MYHTVTVCQGWPYMYNAEWRMPPTIISLWFPTFILPIHLADLAVTNMYFTVGQVTLHDQTWSQEVRGETLF